jgi:hypothetical protein
MLCQTDKEGEERVIACASLQLLKHERNYTPFLVEMQAMVWGMDHCDTYLRGRQFTIFTDYKSLETQSKRQDKTMNRLTEAFLKSNFVIKYKKGSEMPADFLSQNANDAVGLFSDQWKLAQEQDEFCSSMKNICTNTKPIVPANIWKLQTLASYVVDSASKEGRGTFHITGTLVSVKVHGPHLLIMYDEASETERSWIDVKPIFLHRNKDDCPLHLLPKRPEDTTKAAVLVYRLTPIWPENKKLDG